MMALHASQGAAILSSIRAILLAESAVCDREGRREASAYDAIKVFLMRRAAHPGEEWDAAEEGCMRGGRSAPLRALSAGDKDDGVSERDKKLLNIIIIYTLHNVYTAKS